MVLVGPASLAVGLRAAAELLSAGVVVLAPAALVLQVVVARRPILSPDPPSAR